MQYLSLSYFKANFKRCAGMFDAATHSGLSCNGRLHDSFVTIDTMTPGAYKRGGVGLVIDYDYAATPFGQVIIASTSVGLCHIAF